MANTNKTSGAKAAAKSGKTVTLELIASATRREASQGATLTGLGLNKLHRKRILEDTPAVRGMINKVRHMVRIIEG